MLELLPSRADLTVEQFERISTLVKGVCGINLHQGKQEMVRARLAKRLRQLGLHSFEDYFERLNSSSGQEEMVTMLDMLSTNVTQFFREPSHFEFLQDTLIPQRVRAQPGPGRMRIWSAGCSTGQEPYSLAMTLLEHLPGASSWDIAILATDLSTRVLAIAKAGIYSGPQLADVPALWKSKYFTLRQSRPESVYQANDPVRRLVRLAHLNLLESWPMKGPFDAIFCRNVMIYFDKATQGALVDRFTQLLAPGGALFLGHSESLAGVRHRLEYVRPTIYRRA